MYTEDEEEEETREGNSCVDSTEGENVSCGKEVLVFVHNERHQRTHSYSEEFVSPRESLNEESEENHYSETLSLHKSPQVSDFDNEEAETVEEDFTARDSDSVPNSSQVENRTTSPFNLNTYKGNKNHDGKKAIYISRKEHHSYRVNFLDLLKLQF